MDKDYLAKHCPGLLRKMYPPHPTYDLTMTDEEFASRAEEYLAANPEVVEQLLREQAEAQADE